MPASVDNRPLHGGAQIPLPDEQPPLRKGFLEGAQRAVAPEETYQRILPLLAKAGITRVANITGLDHIGIPVFMVCRPAARSLAVSQGKGVVAASARVSGVMESLESYHAEHMRLPLRLASTHALLEELQELQEGHAKLSTRAHAERVVNTQRLPRFETSHYHEHQPLLWVQGRDLFSGDITWVPYEMVHTNYTLPMPEGSGAFAMSSNGLASGNHLMEAVLHGLSEVIERDATSVWSATPRAQRETTRVDLQSVTDATCCQLLACFEQAQTAIAVWDITSDIGVPAFKCTLVDRPDQQRLAGNMYAAVGMGCHPSAAIALIRAMTEAAQSRVTFIAGARDDCDRARYERALNPAVTERITDHVLRVPETLRTFDEDAAPMHASYNEDVRWVLQQLQRVGIDEAVAVNLQLPGFDVPVVRVIVPGLEHPHDAPGYLPGPRAQRAKTQHG